MPMTTKDLDVLKDQMSAVMLAYKKSAEYQGRFSDSTLSQLAAELAQHHQQHFDALNNYLSSQQ